MENYILDKGITNYTGKRHPYYYNLWVITSFELKLMSKSLILKLIVLLSFVPVAIISLWLIFITILKGKGNVVQIFIPPLYFLQLVEVIFFVTLISGSKGIISITKDLEDKTLYFYFTKPITPNLYIGGKFLAIFLINFIVCFVPASLLIGVMLTLAQSELWFKILYFLLPSFLFSLLSAFSIGAFSQFLGTITRKSWLNIIVFIIVLLLPYIASQILNLIKDSSIGKFFNLFSLLNLCAKFVYGMEGKEESSIWLSVVILVILGLISLLLSRMRLEKLLKG